MKELGLGESVGNKGGVARLPAEYLRWRASTLGQVTDALERDLILGLVGPAAGLRILDVGCGDGALAVALSRRGAKVTGIDTSPRMIEAARLRAGRQGADTAFDVATAQSLPFPPDAFDTVIAVTVLCFIEDGTAALGEMERVLRPGGRLVIGELGKWNTWAAGRRIRGWLGSVLWRRAHFRTQRELRALAGKAGLLVNSLTGAIYYPPCGLAARLLGPHDHVFSHLTTVGAAFLALAADKPSK